MSVTTTNFGTVAQGARGEKVLSEPCIMVILGASGDLTKRLLVPALYNLECDGLLSQNFAVLGTSRTELNDEQFRENMAGKEDGLEKFHTRQQFDPAACDRLVSRMHYTTTSISEQDFFRLKERVAELDKVYGANGNVLFYFAMAPRFFGALCENLYKAGFRDGPGWKRIIVEKPFGTDLESARQLNEEILKYWDEEQIYRVDHYLGKETVQNLLAFRFTNGMFEPLWNSNYIDNIQFNVCESVDVQGRGGYYDSSGVLRDMMQNHMFQMLAYLCMEPPGSFEANAIRNEKAKLLQAVRVYEPAEVPKFVVRGQYGPSFSKEGSVERPGYRQEKDVNSNSSTETYAAARFHIDNLRWQGVPIYLRSGKALWKRGTEIVVEFKKPPLATMRGSSVSRLDSNRLIFHIQPYQGIGLTFQAKIPGPTLELQQVDMKFGYGDAFKASRYTGYEVMIYSCSRGDATLFSRGDLVEAAWQIAQPILDYWSSHPAGDEFPNYMRGSWGPKAANDLVRSEGRRWHEVVTPEVLERSPLFQGADPLLLRTVIISLRSISVEAGETIIEIGTPAREMYLICQGEAEVLDASGKVVSTLKDGDFFGEIGLLVSIDRTATVRAKTQCDLFVLEQGDFSRIMRDHPQLAEAMTNVAKERYQVTVSASQLMGPAENS
ncbi:MAG: glucose-6-phosphate dehydrogenase [Deltaproteobacteria bacterium]|nr:glucose-6-phosphate dehydrogenase [Deltaproteobacteria bacterium]